MVSPPLHERAPRPRLPFGLVQLQLHHLVDPYRRADFQTGKRRFARNREGDAGPGAWTRRRRGNVSDGEGKPGVVITGIRAALDEHVGTVPGGLRIAIAREV